MSEEGGDGEDVVSGASSLISYTLRYDSLTELVTLCRVGLREPIHLCVFVNEEGGAFPTSYSSSVTFFFSFCCK